MGVSGGETPRLVELGVVRMQQVVVYGQVLGAGRLADPWWDVQRVGLRALRCPLEYIGSQRGVPHGALPLLGVVILTVVLPHQW